MSRLVRVSHRWISLLFTLTVIANFAAMAGSGGVVPLWVNLMPLPFLFLLLLTGAWMFVLPYLRRAG